MRKQWKYHCLIETLEFPILSPEGVCPRHEQLRREYRSPRDGAR